MERSLQGRQTGKEGRKEVRRKRSNINPTPFEPPPYIHHGMNENTLRFSFFFSVSTVNVQELCSVERNGVFLFLISSQLFTGFIDTVFQFTDIYKLYKQNVFFLLWVFLFFCQKSLHNSKKKWKHINKYLNNYKVNYKFSFQLVKWSNKRIMDLKRNVTEFQVV